jgi:hypothetical protein
MKVSPDNLDAAVMAELDQFAGMLPDEIATAQKAAAKAAVKELKTTSPGKGRYGKGWKAKTTKTRTGAETVIYNGDVPGLAHLLEFGHPIVSGGRTVGQARAFPHIEPTEKNVVDVYEKELTKVLENGT